MMRRARTLLPLLLAALLPLPLVACDDDDDHGTEPVVEHHTLTFAGDASFQGAHGGQAVSVAVVRTGSGAVEATETGTVSTDADPSFSFTFEDALENGVAYEVHYWIDSNFMGGAEGVCDGPEDDHQWRVTLGTVTGDQTVTDSHRPAETESVCSSFE